MHKLSAIVQLLLGAIPERAFFREPASKGPMRPYLQLVQAVRLGDLAAFRTAMEAHAALFTADGNMALVTRLRQNVIRAGCAASAPPPWSRADLGAPALLLTRLRAVRVLASAACATSRSRTRASRSRTSR